MGQWGYGCCHSTIHASYCAGEAGISAAQSSTAQSLLATLVPTENGRSLVEQHNENIPQKKRDNLKEADEPSSLLKKHLGEGSIQLDKDRLANAIKAERERKRKGISTEGDDMSFGKRRKHTEGLSSRSEELTEEQLGMWNFAINCTYLNIISQRHTYG